MFLFLWPLDSKTLDSLIEKIVPASVGHYGFCIIQFQQFTLKSPCMLGAFYFKIKSVFCVCQRQKNNSIVTFQLKIIVLLHKTVNYMYLQHRPKALSSHSPIVPCMHTHLHTLWHQRVTPKSVMRLNVLPKDTKTGTKPVNL